MLLKKWIFSINEKKVERFANFENLLNEIRQMIYILYQAKEMTKRIE